MYILGIDFETTGLDENQDVVTEIGAVLWDWENKMPVRIMDELLAIPDNIKLNPVLVEMNGISGELLVEFGKDPVEEFRKLNEMGEKADYLMAHNAGFDKKFYEASIKETGGQPALSEKIWLDSSADVKYPVSIKTRKLGFLAAEHGFLNPFAHRAVFDVLTMFRVAGDYDIKEIIKCASEQKYELKAKVTFNEKQKARDLGFRWNVEDRSWIKIVGESELRDEAGKCDFGVLYRKKDKEKDWKSLE